MSETKKIRVLETIRQGKIGGGESHVLNLVEALDKSVYEPVVLSFTGGPMITWLEAHGFTNKVIYTEKAFDFSKIAEVKAFLQEQEIDLIHAHGTRANSNTLFAARALNIPMIYTIHGWSFHDDQNFLLRNLRLQSEKFLSSKMNVNIVVSEGNDQAMRKHYKGFRSTRVNYGIDLEKFNPEAKFEDLRTHYSIPGGATLIGYIVRMTKQKDPVSMVRAFAEVLKSEKNIYLLMIGDGDLKEEVLKLIADLGIQDHIRIDGFRQDVPNVLNAIDMYCLPSLWEGLPIGLLEAMAMARAVIVSAVDGSKEIIKDHRNGILIRPTAYKELAAAILELHRKPELRKQMGEEARKTVKDEFNMHLMARKVESIYQQVLKDKK